MIVLDGDDEPVEARRRVELRRSGRPPRRRRAIRSIASRCGRTAAGSRAGQSAASRSLVERGPGREVAERPAEDDDADVDPLAALDARHDAGRRRRRTGYRPRARSASSTNARGCREPPEQVVARTTCGSSPVEPLGRGSRAAISSSSSRGHARREPRVGGRRSSRRTAAARARRSRGTASARGRRPAPSRGGSRARRRGRSARAGRARASRFGFFAVRSTFVTSASNQTIVGGEVGIGRRAGGGAERQRAGQEVDAEVQPGARREQILDLGIGLGAAERRVELDERELGHAKPERARQLAGDDLGDRAPSAPCPAPRNLRT